MISAFKAMASFHSISSFGHDSLERYEEGSIDLLEHRYNITHFKGLMCVPICRSEL